MKRSVVLFLITCSFGLGGCSINATADKMAYKPQTVVSPKQKELIDNVGVATVTGGKKMNIMVSSQIDNPEFKAALETSLKNANLYHKLSGARYKLSSTIMKLDQDGFGLNLAVALLVDYQLDDVIANKTIYKKSILTRHTATFSDSAVAMTRLRIANEGAARKNIQQLISDIDHI
jgi:hypothetical protein